MRGASPCRVQCWILSGLLIGWSVGCSGSGEVAAPTAPSSLDPPTALPGTPAQEEAAPSPRRRPRVVAWVPYWNRGVGATVAAANMARFDSVSPFAYDVRADGTLEDRMARRAGLWAQLRRRAREAGVTVIPSIAWMSGQEIHAVLSDPAARSAHIARIVRLVSTERFDGVDIDYEGKDVVDRKHFSAFLTELSAQLHAMDATLVCTVEGRTQDAPPPGANYAIRMPFAVDYRVAGAVCDEVRVMAYGQWFLTNGAREWTDQRDEPYAPNSDIAWAERALRYTMRFVPPEKILLGVPTHGRLFALEGQPGAWSYRSLGAIHTERVHELMALPSATFDRRDGGELRLRYESQGRPRLAYLSDAHTLAERFELVARLGVAGIALFKIDGREDPALWEVLERARAVGAAP